ncbi:MAG: hypothetical protein O3C33_07150 [Actinomycetota bacterium]|nr:hypothetical protein [Actinomycetota bacterium]
MSKYRIAAATLATVAGFCLLGPTSVSAAKNDGPGNGRANGGEQAVGATEVALHNDRADSGTDCPTNGAWWHFVLAPNSGAHTIEAMRLMVSGSEHIVTAAQIVLNHGQTDNVFVAVPEGHSIDGLSSSGSSATVTGPGGRVRFVLSHVCGQSTDDSEDGSNDEIVTEDITSDDTETDDITTEENETESDDEIATEDTTSDDTATDDTQTDEIVTEDITSDDTETDDITTEDIATDDEITTEDITSDDTATDDTQTDDITTEDIATDDEKTTEENEDNPTNVEIDHDADGYPARKVDMEVTDAAADASPSDGTDVPVLNAQIIEPVIEDAPEAVSPVEQIHINFDDTPTSDITHHADATTTSTTETVEASQTASLPKTGLGLGLVGLAIMLIGLGEAIRRGTARTAA